MPIYDEPRRAIDAPSAFPERQPEEDAQGSVLGAAFLDDDNITSNAIQGVKNRAPLDPQRYFDKFGELSDYDFEPWEYIEGTPYEEYYPDLVGVRSKAELDRATQGLDRYFHSQKVLNQAGAGGYAARMFASIVDLPTLLPGFALAKGGRMATTAIRTAAAAGTEAVAVEGALHRLQAARTIEDSALAIGGSILLGGALGGAVGAIRKNPAGEAQFRRSADWLDGKDPDISDDLDVELRRIENRDLSAAAVGQPLSSDFELPTKAASTAVKLTPSGTTYGYTFIKAQSPVAQKTGMELIETPFPIAGVDRLNLEPAVETAVKVGFDQAQVRITRAISDQFADYRKSRGISRTASAFNRVGDENLNRRQFSEQVAYALRRDDQSANRYVQKAAQQLRREVIEPLKERAIRAGLLPEDVKVTTAASYFTRQWNSDEIVRRAPEFKARMAAHFARQFDAEAKAGKISMDNQEISGFADEAANEVFRTLTGEDPFPSGLGITVKARGPLKERSLNVRDEDFEDFLHSDVEHVLGRYARVMSADVALKERFGSTSLEQQIRDINADYQKRIDEAKTGDERSKLNKEQKRVVERVEAARDLLRGTYQIGARNGVPYRVMQSLMAANFIRALGGLVLSALPDVFRFSMTHGVSNLWGGAVRPLMTNLKQHRSVSRDLAEVAGIAEIALNTRLLRVADVTDPIGQRTPVESAIDAMSSVASTLSGGTAWNQFLKELAVSVTTRRFRELDFSNASDKAMLQRLKVNTRDAQEIQRLMRENGVEAEGVFDPRVDTWPERIKSIYAQAMRADADSIIVTPSLGDKIPGVEAHPWLRPALQFKNFAVAAHSRVMVAGLAEDQARFLASAAGAVSMGMFVYAAKSYLAGREPSDNPGVWLAEGIDRSGAVPLILEMNNWYESFNLPGIYSILSMGEAEASRYAVRSTAGKVLGPTAGLLNDSATTMRAVASQINPLASEEAKDITAGDIGSARRLIPFGRHPGFQQYLDLWLLPHLKERLE